MRWYLGLVLVLVVVVSGCVDVYREEVTTTSTITATSTTNSTTSTTTTSTSTTVITYPIEIEFDTLSNSPRCKGTSNRGIEDLYYVINNESALESIWDIQFNGEFPKIDFLNNAVVAVFWLDVLLGRGSIEISRILEYRDEVFVLPNKEYIPRVGPAQRMLRVHPCHMVKIKKIDKPVRFIETRKFCTEDADCVPEDCCRPTECVNVDFKECQKEYICCLCADCRTCIGGCKCVNNTCETIYVGGCC